MSFSKPITMKRALAAAALTAFIGTSNAHSWIEEMQAIGDNGSYTGDYGYTRGYMARTEGGFNGDSVDYLLPPLSSGRTRINGRDLLCHPSQRTSNYTTDYPQLQIASGGYIAIKYLENGHVTLPDTQKGKPKAGGTVFIYGTTQPSETEKIANVLEWTANGTGGDKRGTLIASQNFDDGRCHQLNSGTISLQRQKDFPDRVAGQPTSQSEQWCENDVQIPASIAKAGETLTLYWVWQWPTAPGEDSSLPDGKDEYYTSCSDVKIVDTVADVGTPIHTLVQQDPQTNAVSDWKSRTAYTSTPSVTLAGATGSATSGASSSDSTPLSKSSSSAAYTSAVTSASASARASAAASTGAARLGSSSSSSSAATSLYPSTNTSLPAAGNLPYMTYSLSYLPTFTTSFYSTSTSASSAATNNSTISNAFQNSRLSSSLSSSSVADGALTIFATTTATMTVSASPATVTVTVTVAASADAGVPSSQAQALAHAADATAGLAGVVGRGNGRRGVGFVA